MTNKIDFKLLPKDIEDITLEQSCKYMEIVGRDDIDDVAKTQRIIKLFTGMTNTQVVDMPMNDYEAAYSVISKALNADVEFKNRFTLDGVEYGFVPNLDVISAGEYIDLSGYGMSAENMHKVMAVLFRPIIESDNAGYYKIEPYRVDKERQLLMKQAPMNIVNGMLVFFCLLSKELQVSTRRYMEENLGEARKKLALTLRNGDGM
tara:strand:+ start:17 stop:631 length:615 start_codon:yes stop_codon:yes gene_type:complete